MTELLLLLTDMLRVPAVRAIQSWRRHWSATARQLKDPWPLPHTPEHIAYTATAADTLPPTPLPRPNETIETLRARLVYQSRKRGTLESDLLLSTFARDNLKLMSEAELKEYDKVCVYACVYWRR